MVRSWQVGLVLIIGILAISTAAIFIRLSMIAAGMKGVGFSLFLAASRLTIAATILLPTWPTLKGARVPIQAYYYGGGAGISLALHVAIWIVSLSFTSIAASTALVTTNPIWISLFSWLWFREKLTRLTVLGITVALLGGITIGLGDIDIPHKSSNFLLGNFLALVGAWLVSLYFLLGREAQRNGLSVGHYAGIAYSTAAVFLLPLPLLWGSGYLGYPKAVYGYVFLLAVFSQLVGHTSLNWAVRWISPTLVSLAILFEPIGASLLGFFIFGEVPPPFVFWGGMVLLIGVAMAIIGEKKRTL